MLLIYSTRTLCQVFAIEFVDDEFGVVGFQKMLVKGRVLVLIILTFWGRILRHLNCRSGCLLRRLMLLFKDHIGALSPLYLVSSHCWLD